MLGKLAGEREQYDRTFARRLTLCDPGMLGRAPAQRVYIEGAAQMAAASEFPDQDQLRDVLAAIEEKHRIIALLNHCIDTPDPVHVQIGVEGMTSTGGTSGSDQRAVFVSGSIAGNGGRAWSHAHAV